MYNLAFLKRICAGPPEPTTKLGNKGTASKGKIPPCVTVVDADVDSMSRIPSVSYSSAKPMKNGDAQAAAAAAGGGCCVPPGAEEDGEAAAVAFTLKKPRRSSSINPPAEGESA